MSSAICILGGMGPQALVYMYKVLIDNAVEEFGAKNNDDFPEIIVHSIPVPDFISNPKNKSKALSMLVKRVDDLDKMDISFFAIACNTAHILLSDLSTHSSKPFVSMIDAVVDEAYRRGYKKIGLLGSPGTLNSKIYQVGFKRKNISVIKPSKNDILTLERVIRKVIANSVGEEDKRKLVEIANGLVEKGAECIVLGCTELPLIFPQRYKYPHLNSVEVLSKKLLKGYYPKIMKS